MTVWFHIWCTLGCQWKQFVPQTLFIDHETQLFLFFRMLICRVKRHNLIVWTKIHKWSKWYCLSIHTMDWAVSVAKNDESSKRENKKSLQQNIYFWARKLLLVQLCVCVWGDYAVYGLWASSTAYPEVWSFLSELVISLSLSTPMLQPPRLSLTGRRSGGVWGKWWGHCTPTQFSSCSWHCVFLTRCVSWRFAFLHFFFS